MKLWIGAAVSALLLSSAALAQTTPTTPATPAADTLPTQCGTIAPTPSIPDGGHATATQMHTADTAYRAWATDTEAKLHCRAAEIEAADAQVKAAAAAFQAQSAAARDASTAYSASVQAFNSRGAHAHVDDHHGGLVSSHE
jgi:hypothetical protein